MRFAKELVELEERLCDRGKVAPFLPMGQSGIPSSPDCAKLTTRLVIRQPWGAIDVLRLCLQVLCVQHDLPLFVASGC